MRRVVAAVGLLALLGARPSRGDRGRVGCRTDRLPVVDFDRHVAGLFGRLGCNAGACHGSFQGRGGLSLSLFGHDPARDFEALTHAAHGPPRQRARPRPQPRAAQGHRAGPPRGGPAVRARVLGVPGHPRLDRRRRPARPGASGGRGDRDPAPASRASNARARPAGSRSSPGSPTAPRPTSPRSATSAPGPRGRRRLHRGGGPRPPTRRHRAGRVLQRPRRGGPGLRPDRAARDHPRRARRRPRRPRGLRQAPRPGHRALGPGLRRRVPPPGHARRDRHPADAGRGPRLPRRRVARQAFRGRSTRLLAHPMHAALWATRYLDITGCDVDAMEGPDDLRPRRARLWHDWFRKRFADNAPTTRSPAASSARPAATATTPGPGPGREAGRMLALKGGGDTGYADKPGLDLFWRRFVNGEYAPVEPLAERVAAAFLGVRIECAQCHKHPFDRWTRADYRAFANTVADVQFGLSPDGLAATAALLEDRRKADPDGALPPIPRIREAYVSGRSTRRLRRPRHRPAPRAPRPRRARAGRRRRPARTALRLAREAGQPVLRPQLREPRLGRLLRRRPRGPGRRLLGHQPALERPAARRPGGRLRRPRLRRPPARADGPELPGLPALLGAGRGEPRRPGQLRPVGAEAPDGGGPRRRRSTPHSGCPGISGRTPRRVAGPSRSPRTGWRRPTSPGPSGSSAGPSGPRSATASGRRPRPCRRRSSS